MLVGMSILTMLTVLLPYTLHQVHMYVCIYVQYACMYVFYCIHVYIQTFKGLTVIASSTK